MFKIRIKGTRVAVSRSLELPRAGQLPSKVLSCTTQIKLTLGGIDLRSDTAREIIGMFENVYAYELDMRGKKQDAAFVKAWKDMASDLESAADARAVQKLARAFESEVLDKWNDFNVNEAKRYAQSSLQSAIREVGKKHKIAGARPKLDFSAEELKSDRLGILGALMGAVTFAASGGTLGWLAAGLGGLLTIAKGYRSAWSLGQKRISDAATNMARINTTLATCASALAKLDPELSKLATQEQQIQTQIADSTNQLRKLRAELAALEKRSKTEEPVREGKYLPALAAKVENTRTSLDQLRKSLGDLGQLRAAIADARKSVEAAQKRSEIERKGWDGLMDRYTRITTESDSVFSALEKLTKAVP